MTKIRQIDFQGKDIDISICSVHKKVVKLPIQLDQPIALFRLSETGEDYLSAS